MTSLVTGGMTYIHEAGCGIPGDEGEGEVVDIAVDRRGVRAL